MAVIFKADSDFSKVLKDYERMTQRVVTLEEKLKAVTRESGKQDGAFKATFEGGIGQLKAMVGTYISLHGAISLVNTGLNEQKRISAEIHRVQMTAADAQSEVVKNLGNVSTEQASKFLKEIEGIASRGGAPGVAPVYVAAAQTLSAVGDETLTKSILSESLPFFKSKMEELPTFAGAVGDLANISGAKTEEEVRRIVALVLSSQKYSRGATLDSFKNVAPAVAAVSAVDTSGDRIRAEREALALNAAISTAIADPDMALTKTATAEVATALAELLPERDIIGLDKYGGRQVERRGTGLKTMAERLAAVQANVDLQRRFFDTGEGFQMASFRGPIKPVIQELVSSPDSPIAQKFREAFAGITDDTSIVTQMKKNLSFATPQLGLAESTRKGAAVIEGYQLTSGAGNLAFARSQVEKGLEQTGGFLDLALGNRIAHGALEAQIASGVDPLLAASDILQTRKSQLMFPLSPMDVILGSDEDVFAKRNLADKDQSYAAQRESELTGTVKEQVQALTRLIQILERQYAMGTIGTSAAAAADLRNQREGM